MEGTWTNEGLASLSTEELSQRDENETGRELQGLAGQVSAWTVAAAIWLKGLWTAASAEWSDTRECRTPGKTGHGGRRHFTKAVW